MWDFIDKAVLATEVRPQSRTAKLPSVWPSEASAISVQGGENKIEGKCARASYLRMTGFEATNPVDNVGAWRFISGRLIEDHLTSMAKYANIFIANGVRTIVKNIYLPLEMDLITIDPDNGEGWIIECKTYYGYNAKKEIENNNTPKTSNLMQVCLYLNEFPTGKKLKEVIAESLEQKKLGLDTRNRIEINQENLDKLSDGPMQAKLVYISRDECLRKEFNITIQEDFDGMHYPCVDGIMYRMFTIESLYSRYKTLQSYWFAARNAAVEKLANKGKIKPDSLNLILKPGDPIDTRVLNEEEEVYLKSLEIEVRNLPDTYWPPAEYEWSYSPEKVERLYSIGEIAKTKYADWKKKRPGKDRIGDFHCSYCNYKRLCIPKQGNGAFAGYSFDIDNLQLSDD